MYVAMRLGPLVRLLVGVAVVSALVLVVIMAQAPAHGSGGPATPSSTLAAAAGALPLFRIVRTDGGGLNVRSCPSSTCARVGWVGEGGSFTVDCSVTGSAEHGDVTWLRGMVGGRTGYAARYYLVPTSAAVDNQTTGVPACDRLAAAKG
jgi:hypothetical protein